MCKMGVGLVQLHVFLQGVRAET
uniref:Uncharacterized protein n=1 Tax=Anguilla anguilla TaxID=7936 RepID=A0A0E9VXD8_ANGAN